MWLFINNCFPPLDIKFLRRCSLCFACSWIPNVSHSMKNIKQLILIIDRFCSCKFTYSIQFICNLKTSIHDTLVSRGHAQNGKNLSCLTHKFSSVVKQSHLLLPCFSSHPINKYSFTVCLKPCIWHFCVIC